MRYFISALCILSSLKIAGQDGIFCHASQHTLSYYQTGTAGMADNYYYWEPGRTLYIRFLNGSSALQSKILSVAKEWLQHANIKFELRRQGESHIRIDLNRKGYISSVIGVQANTVPQDEANVLIDTSSFSSEKNIRAIVLHTFGHILGLQHEIILPSHGRKWNSNSVIKYFTRFGWNENRITGDFFDKYSIPSANNIVSDSSSVMHVPVPALWTGERKRNWNTRLSAQDKTLIKAIYPAEKKNRRDPFFKIYGFDSVIIKRSAKGLLFYPVFDAVFRNLNTSVFSVAVFDENDKIVPGDYDSYFWGEQLAGLKIFVVVPDGRYAINKSKTDLVLFLPYSKIPSEYELANLQFVFKSNSENHHTGEQLSYTSKPYRLANGQ